MNIQAASPVNKDGSTYKGVNLTSGKTHYHIMQVSGKLNYVNVLNKNNPYSLLGRQFESFEEAKNAYKSPLIQTMLLMAEVEFYI